MVPKLWQAEAGRGQDRKAEPGPWREPQRTGHVRGVVAERLGFSQPANPGSGPSPWLTAETGKRVLGEAAMQTSGSLLPLHHPLGSRLKGAPVWEVSSMSVTGPQAPSYTLSILFKCRELPTHGEFILC